MRSAAQRNIEQQGLMLADTGSMGINISAGTQAAIDRAFKAWIARRGIDNTTSFGKRDFSKKGRPPKSATPAPVEMPAQRKEPKPARPRIVVPRDKPTRSKMTPEELKVRRAEQRKAFRERHLERVRAAARIAAQKRRDSLTPEERKANNARIVAYNRAARERRAKERENAAQ